MKKHIKSGRDLCQLSSGDLEAKLGIRHVLHRKKVFISLHPILCAFVYDFELDFVYDFSEVHIRFDKAKNMI